MKMSDNKIRVAVLYGGRSLEHEVSIRSASSVINQLDTSRFDIIPIGVDKQGNWFLGHDVFEKSLEYQGVSRLDKTAWFSPETIAQPPAHSTISQLTQTAEPSTTQFDVIFPVMHGSLCEDGTLQGLLEMANIPYVGCGVLSSAIGMDKDIAKRLVREAGIQVAPYFAVKQAHWEKDPLTISNQVREILSYPVFVKPANTGSSVGISKVKTPDKLQRAIEEAFQFDTKILIEKALNVQELEIGVLESLDPSADPIVSVVGEIRPRHEFYSYDAKYLDENGAELLIPASVSDKVKEKAREIAKTIFTTLECEGMARVDLFFDKDSQQIYFNEINTIPGFTQISMYPKLMVASGIAYPQLLTHLIELAMKRYQLKSKLNRGHELFS